MICSEGKIRKDILRVSHLMYQNRLVNAYEGNVSVRSGSNLYFTPSGICKGFLEEDMIIVTDMGGKVLSAKQGYKLTSEAKMHLEVYRLREDVFSVVHTHSPWATAYAIANKPIQTKAYPEMIVLFDKIPVAKYGTPSTDEIYSDFHRLFKDRDVILLANHGLVSSGKDVFDAYFKNEAVESCAKTLAIADMIGGPAELDNSELEKLYSIREKMFNKNL